MGSRQIQPEDFGLSQQQFDEIKGVFDHFDTDASGRLLRLRRFGRTNSDFLAHYTQLKQSNQNRLIIASMAAP